MSRKLIIIGSIILTQITTQINAQINDKLQHFGAGSLAGYYGASLELATTNNVHPYLICIGSATLAGTAKELMDLQTTGFDKKDLVATIAGGVLSGTIIYIIKRRHARKKAKQLFR